MATVMGWHTNASFTTWCNFSLLCIKYYRFCL